MWMISREPLASCLQLKANCDATSATDLEGFVAKVVSCWRYNPMGRTCKPYRYSEMEVCMMTGMAWPCKNINVSEMSSSLNKLVGTLWKYTV